jgi:hypothetical protein
MIRAAPLPTKNRLAFLTLDSTLEIAMRLFLKHKNRITLDPQKHRRRDVLLDMMKKNMKQDDDLWDQLTYCYENIRCPLYHEASDMTVTDVMLDDFQETVCFLLKEMFGIDAAATVAEGAPAESEPSSVPSGSLVDLNRLTKVDAVVLSVGREPRKDASAILSDLRSLGYTARLDLNTISAYLSRGGYFFKDPADGLWRLTEFVGRKRFRQITEVSQ